MSKLVSRLLSSGYATLILLVPMLACAEQVKHGDPALQEIQEFIDTQKIDKSKTGWKESLPKPPQAQSFEEGKRYLWDLETNQGKLVIEFKPDVAPMHVSSTIYLTLLGFYDDVVFHRVITGFMAQGGDPTGTGRGGPGYKYDGEYSPKARHDKPGILSMANAGPGTDGSQFFITFGPTPHLDDKHTVFGEVVGGKSTLDRLEERGSGSGRTREKLVIQKASVRVE